MNLWRSIINRNQYCCMPGCRGSSSSDTKLKFFRFSKSPVWQVSWFLLKICEECSCLFMEHVASYNGFYAPKILIFNSEFSDSVLLFGIVILILHLPNALLNTVTLFSCFHWIDKGMCVFDYIHCSQLGSLPVIWVTNHLAW